MIFLGEFGSCLMEEALNKMLWCKHSGACCASCSRAAHIENLLVLLWKLDVTLIAMASLSGIFCRDNNSHRQSKSSGRLIWLVLKLMKYFYCT